MVEEWKPVVGHENEYEVSNLGRVKSLAREVRIVRGSVEGTMPVKERILTPLKKTKQGYRSVGLGKYEKQLVHILVAEAFLGPRPEGMYVGHLNGDPSDNRAANLAYITPAENCHHRIHHGRAKVTVEQVRAIKAKPEWGPGEKASWAAEMGVTAEFINAIVRGRAYTHV